MAYHPILPSLASVLLNTPMPTLGRGTSEYVTVNLSSTTTARTVAPKAFLPLDPSVLDTALTNTPGLAAQLSQHVDAVMVEKSHLIVSEGDVERALHLYLFHGINQILQRFLLIRRPGDSLTCSSQITANIDKTSRVDILWRVGGRVVLVMEVKNWGALDVNEWLNAVVTGNSPQERAQALAQKLKAAEGTPHHTAALKNAGVILKQATKYAEEYEVPIVLVCDWGKMVYLDMEPDGRQWNDADTFPHFLWVDAMAGGGAGNNPMTFRGVLLAAFLVALDKLGL